MKSFVSLFSIIFVFYSCSSVKVISDYDSAVDFNKYSTFAFSKQEIEKINISDIDKKRILKSIEEIMKSKGYSFSSNPDLIINISTKSREDIYINQTYNSFNYGWYGFPYDQIYRPYTRTTGLLYIDIIDSKNGSLIWNASGSGSLFSGKLSRDELISNFVNKVLESYPSQS
ncbi:MAG: DUF4136 domain-containing protein [Flavobacteriaceae bacterium]|nr:DUF4136 domain-containing protein [Flavobacteriaceae bacterium]MBL6684673.1 DUF4136 domain-containing protein [Flavobacteriaceae bacterium]